jgi:predicted porin
MQKRILSSAIALALTALASGAAMAQSSVTLYGNIDVSVDRVSRELGTPLNAITAPLNTKLGATRVGPDLSSQSALGFRGVEDLGGGYKGNFTLESQFGADNGALLRDGRLFGRQAFVGLTTPFGEVRLGRQYAPIFFSSAVITIERFGGTDQFIEGGLTNSLNIRWDNAITYTAKVGGFSGQLGYSPNAGVAQKVNPLRNGTGGSDAGGQIAGGISAGTENDKGRGRSWGAFGAYNVDDLTLSAGYSSTSFTNVPVQTVVPVQGINTALTLFQVGDYSAWNLGAKYVLKDLGLTFNGAFGRATYALTGTQPLGAALGFSNGSLAMSPLVLGMRYETGAVALLAQWSETKFRNESRGKDRGITLGAEYSLSKRSTLYTRYAEIKDSGAGPAVVLPAVGIREIPVMGGAGISPNGKTSMVAIGVRHSF